MLDGGLIRGFCEFSMLIYAQNQVHIRFKLIIWEGRTSVCQVIMNCVKMQAFQPIKLKKFYVNCFNVLKIAWIDWIVAKITTICCDVTPILFDCLFCFLVQCMSLAESTILLDLHSVRMGLFLLCSIVVTLLALRTCQCRTLLVVYLIGKMYIRSFFYAHGHPDEMIFNFMGWKACIFTQFMITLR